MGFLGILLMRLKVNERRVELMGGMGQFNILTHEWTCKLYVFSIVLLVCLIKKTGSKPCKHLTLSTPLCSVGVNPCSIKQALKWKRAERKKQNKTSASLFFKYSCVYTSRETL